MMEKESLAEFDSLAKSLTSKGEDKAELEFWREIFHDLEPEQRMELIANLKKELAELEQL